MIKKTSIVIPIKVGGISKILRMKYSFTSRKNCPSKLDLARRSSDQSCTRADTAARVARLAWWPSQCATREQVQVQMRHGFSGIATMIDHDAKTIFCDALLLGDDANSRHQMT